MIGLLGITVEVAGRTLTTVGGPVFPEDIAPRLTSYEHSISATCGFESCTLSFVARDLEEALRWQDRLACPVTCYGPDADMIWDGLLVAADVTVGGRARSISLDTVVNRARVRYTTPLSTAAATATAAHARSQALYGVRDGMLSVAKIDLTEANALRDRYLNTYALPRPRTSSALSVGSPGESGGAIEISLLATGRYTTLDWAMLERNDSSAETTTTQVADLIGSGTYGVGAVNGWISTSAQEVEASGVSMSRKVEADTTWRAAIEKRLSVGSASNQRYAWGVYEDRRLRVRTWAGANPGSVGYRLRLADAEVRSGSGGQVELWQVRPDAMVEESDFVEAGPPSGAVDTLSTYYLERVTFAADGSGMSLSLEPEASSSLDARIARVSG